MAATSHSRNGLLVVKFLRRSGREPVREWLKELPPCEKRNMSNAIGKVATGFPRPQGKSLYRPMGRGLYEVKAKARDRELRVLFILKENEMILVHGFIKKSEKTPSKEIEIALQRLKPKG